MTETPTYANENCPKASNEELIDLAYSMAVEPQRYRILARILDDRLHNFYTSSKMADGNLSNNDENLEDISNHFERAFELLERQGRRFNYATGSIRFIDSDTRPSALIRADGTIFHANKAAIAALAFSKEKRPNPERFEHGELDRMLRDLKKIGAHETNKIVSVYNFISSGDEQVKMALSKAIDYHGNPIGRLCTFHIKWQPEQGRQFREGFSLTDVDLAITKAIISGKSLRDLADERGRSLSTIRTQVKVLLSKLGLHSQVELACLYSGFTQFNLKDESRVEIPQPKREPWRAQFKLDLSDGRKLQYEMVGPPNGRPVLFFHSIVSGLVLTQTMRDTISRYNIRLIMVWRPFFAGSSPDKKIKGSTGRFAQDIAYLLDRLEVETCQILGIISGAIYAYACARYMPKRISSLVISSGCVPILTRAQFKQIAPAFRASIYVARFTPKLLPMLLRSMLTQLDSGYDEEFGQEVYEHSQVDQNILMDEEVKTLMRDSFTQSTLQGYASFVRDIQIQASRWEYLLAGVNCPVALLHGEQDPDYRISMVRDMVSDKPNFTLLPFTDGGQLTFFQHPEATFKALAGQYSATKLDVRTEVM